MGELPLAQTARRRSNHLRGRFVSGPKVWMERNWRVSAIDSLRRSIEEMKAMGDHGSDHFSVHSAPGPGFCHAKQFSGSGHRAEHRLNVQWFNAPKVDNFDIDIFFPQLLGGSECVVNHRAVRDDRQVSSGADNSRLIIGQVGFRKSV